ncbi:MAG: YraN family protein [Alkalispirochaetaceae bacterium]
MSRQPPRGRRSTTDRGREGESSAASYLVSQGYTILEKNFRRVTGEVDIVCERQGVLTFVEVKRWPRAFMSELSIALSGRRRQRMRQTAELFVLEHPKYRGERISLDLIFVAGDGGEVRHIPGAL